MRFDDLGNALYAHVVQRASVLEFVVDARYLALPETLGTTKHANSRGFAWVNRLSVRQRDLGLLSKQVPVPLPLKDNL
jgi:hypothetical protein